MLQRDTLQSCNFSVHHGGELGIGCRNMSAALADTGSVCDWLPSELVTKHHLMSLSSGAVNLFSFQFDAAEQASHLALMSSQVCSLLWREELELAGHKPLSTL